MKSPVLVNLELAASRVDNENIWGNNSGLDLNPFHRVGGERRCNNLALETAADPALGSISHNKLRPRNPWWWGGGLASSAMVA